MERDGHRRPLHPPRYRIEHREDDKPALIVAFADTDLGLRAALAQQTARYLRARTGGTLVAIDQASEEVVAVHELPSLGYAPVGAPKGVEGMRLDPEPDQLTYTVLVWLGIAQRLHDRDDDALAAAIRAAMDRRRLDELVPVSLTADERAQVQAVLDIGDDASP